jgi:glutamate synthase (NADPH/NADH) large chain
LEAHQPVLSNDDIAKLRNIHKATKGQFKSLVLDITYPAKQGAKGCAAALKALRKAASQSVADGYNILILSDRNVSRDRVAIPALLATSGIHHHLVNAGLRTSTGLVVDTGSARETHHVALLAGYGAEAICPWLAFDTIAQLPINCPAGLMPKKPKAFYQRR